MDRPPFQSSRQGRQTRRRADRSQRAGTADTRTGSGAPELPLTVTELTRLITDAIERALPERIHVIGQISNFKHHSSGHRYFTLKDGTSELACVMWRSSADRLRFRPEDGMEVIAQGRVGVFERSGRYQLYADRLEPRGVGALELAFRQLREKLEREGLFEARRKKPLPTFPERVVLVTSPTGAAVRDMLRTLQRRFPCLTVWVYPVPVQGEGAGDRIAEAIHRINVGLGGPQGADLMIVGRGGGSIEDLWAFNEEVVARAISASRIPVISAVGHEVDVTICDLVADVRAATPTAAAELAVPVLADVMDDIDLQAMRLGRAVRTAVALSSGRWAGLAGRWAYREPLRIVRQREQDVDTLGSRMVRGIGTTLARRRRRLDALEPIIARIAPSTFLAATAERLRDARERLLLGVRDRLRRSERAVVGVQRRFDWVSPPRLLPQWAQRVDHLERRVARAWVQRVASLRERLDTRRQHLDALGHRSILRRGFSITRTRRDRRIVTSTQDLKDRQRIVTELYEGEVESEIVNLHQLELFDSEDGA